MMRSMGGAASEDEPGHTAGSHEGGSDDGSDDEGPPALEAAE